jgi:hypothetical protein
MKCKNTDCENDVKNDRVYCSFKCRNIYVNRNLRDYTKVSNTLIEKLGVSSNYLTNPKKCKECGRKLSYEKRKNTFCDKSCSTIFNNRIKPPMSNEQRKAISLKVKQLWEDGVYDTSSAKQVIHNKKLFSSKNERYIVDYFKKNFIDDAWMSGGCLKYKNERISRDLFSSKLKICFEYDGIWHFKDIYNQLDKKQFKDNLLEEWCSEQGYRLIRVDENSYEDINQIIDLIYNRNDKIIKMGTRYVK